MAHKKIVLTIALVAAMLTVPVFATATPISGDFGMGGSVTVTAVDLNFFCTFVCPGTSGDPVISGITTTGDFTGLGGTTAFVQDISHTGGQPLNVPISLPAWITFASAPSLFLDLQFIPLGVGIASPDCVGVPFCTPIIGGPLITPANPSGLSAFNLSPGSASLEVQGIGYSGSSATGSTPFIGRFSMDFPGLSAEDILALFNTPPGIVNKAYSAAFVVRSVPGTNVPEPSTGLLMLGGVFLMASRSLRRYLRRRGAKGEESALT